MIFLPTRGRPEGLKRFVQACANTEATMRILVGLDWDDPKLNDYIPGDLMVAVSHLRGLAAIQNEMFKAYPHEDVYAFLADDAVPRTKHWDRLLSQAALAHGIAYPDDLYGTDDHDRRHNHFCIRGDLLRAVGYFAPPGFYHLFVDDVWMAIGDALGVGVYLGDVVVEHVHFGNGKAEYDDTYKQHGKHFYEDKAAFENWRKNDLGSVVERVKKEMGV